jgi:hypothetical protein
MARKFPISETAISLFKAKPDEIGGVPSTSRETFGIV